MSLDVIVANRSLAAGVTVIASGFSAILLTFATLGAEGRADAWLRLQEAQQQLTVASIQFSMHPSTFEYREAVVDARRLVERRRHALRQATEPERLLIPALAFIIAGTLATAWKEELKPREHPRRLIPIGAAVLVLLGLGLVSWVLL